MKDLCIHYTFSDHMVLQRQKPINVWGTCVGQEEIQVILGSTCVSASVDEGKWSAVLPPMEAAKNLTLKVCTKQEEIKIVDVAVGEVWIAGGQSNMEFYMKYERHYGKEIDVCQDFDIRFFDVPELCYPGQEKDFDFSKMGFWRTCDKGNLEYFTAVGYYYAKNIYKDLSVPIGIIGCNRGESPLVSWVPEEIAFSNGAVWQQEFIDSLKGQSEEEALEKYRCSSAADRGNPFADEFSNKLLYGISREEQLEMMSNMPTDLDTVVSFHTKPASLYENMLLTIVPYTVRGVLWYHGETDSQHPECYKALCSKMIDCWREQWHEELPFLIIEVAPFKQWLWCVGDNFPIIRSIQREIADEKAKVYLCSTEGAGEDWDIHPKNKKIVGERLARLALKEIY